MLIQMLLIQQKAAYEGMLQLEKSKSEHEIQKLKSEARFHKSRADHFEQLYIQEKLRSSSK